MTRIQHTNIIIDEFSHAKSDSTRVYTHILTHIHTDHLKGLHDGWNYGPIYCTQPTMALLLHKFPNLTNINTIQLQTPTEIKMSPMLSVTVTFFDANHCIGGVMVLIEGYMGTVLYTGDMRFDREIFRNYKHLYPASKLNHNFQRCSKHIDILYVDNTFLKKKFDFPPKSKVLKMAVEYVQELLNLNKHSRIFIGLDSFGKEQVLAELSNHFNMYIVVDDLRYEVLRQTPLDLDIFSTNKQDGVVQVVRKDKLYACLRECEQSVGIILSGWVNHPTYRFNQTIYCLPYSLHSNYHEIHEFVNSIGPSFIYPIVHCFPDENRLFYAGGREVSKRDLMFNQQLFEQERGNYQEEIQELRALYCSQPTEEYQVLSMDVEMQKRIDQQLRPPNFASFFTKEKVTPLHMQVAERRKYRLPNNRNELQINRLKNQIKLKKKIIEGEPIEIIEEDEDNSRWKNPVIDLQEDGQFQAMRDEVVEVDPLFQPISRRKQTNRDSKRGRNLLAGHSEYSRQQAKILENIRSKFKQNELASPLGGIAKTGNEVKGQNGGPQRSMDVQSQTSSKMEIDLLSNNSGRGSLSSGAGVGLLGVDFERFKKIKVLKNKQVIITQLEQSPQQLAFIRALLKGQSKTCK